MHHRTCFSGKIYYTNEMVNLTKVCIIDMGKKCYTNEHFSNEGCYVEKKIRAGYKRKCEYPSNGLPKSNDGLKKRGMRSPMIDVFNLDGKEK